MSALSPGDEHVVALASQVPIDDRAHPTGRTSARSAR